MQYSVVQRKVNVYNFKLIQYYCFCIGRHTSHNTCQFPRKLHNMSSFLQQMNPFNCLPANILNLQQDEAKKIKCMIIGLDGAGKTSLLYDFLIFFIIFILNSYNLALGPASRTTIPTIGFNVEKVFYKNLVFEMWDLGGSDKIQQLWKHYYNETRVIFYVVDCLHEDRLRESKHVLYNTLKSLNEETQVLIYATKQDYKHSMGAAELVEYFELPSLKQKWFVVPCNAQTGEGILAGMAWLYDQFKHEFK